MIEGTVKFHLRIGQIATLDGHFGKQLVRDGDILGRSVMSGRFDQSSCIFFSPLQIALREPVLRLTGLEPDVVAPAKPIIARKDRFDLAKDRKRLLVLASNCVVIAEVD